MPAHHFLTEVALKYPQLNGVVRCQVMSRGTFSSSPRSISAAHLCRSSLPLIACLRELKPHAIGKTEGVSWIELVSPGNAGFGFAHHLSCEIESDIDEGLG